MVLPLGHVLMGEEPAWSPQASVFRTVSGLDGWFSRMKATGDSGRQAASLCPCQGLSLLFSLTPWCWAQGLAHHGSSGESCLKKEGLFWKPSLGWGLV